MPEEVTTLVRIPLSEIESSVRAKHLLPKILKDVRLEEDALVLCFSDEPKFLKEEESPLSSNIGRRRRRAQRRRNRMKTRGWEAVARITNSKEQKCTIYKPFVDALNEPKLTTEEQKRLVEKILRSNRNRPSEGSIQYFLENTREYLQKQSEQNPQDKVA